MSRRKRVINICKIAEEVGVSAATVSRVINRRVGVGEETRKKVNELLRKYNFTPDFPVVRTIKLAVVIPGHDMSERIRQALKGIYAYAQLNELMVNIIVANHPRKETLLEAIRDQQCSGVIAISTQSLFKELISLSETDLPVVVIDSQIDDPNIGFIDNDSYSGSAEATRHLIELGHKKIGYLQYCTPSLNQIQRYKGYENTMKASGLKSHANWVANSPPAQGEHIRGMPGLKAMKQLLNQAPELTAVLAVDDDMAMGAMSAIYGKGLKIPDNISLVGFDNCPESQVWFPSLTTVNHPVEHAGHKAAKSVHAALMSPGKWTPPREIMATQLVVRKSTCQPGNK